MNPAYRANPMEMPTTGFIPGGYTGSSTSEVTAELRELAVGSPSIPAVYDLASTSYMQATGSPGYENAMMIKHVDSNTSLYATLSPSVSIFSPTTAQGNEYETIPELPEVEILPSLNFVGSHYDQLSGSRNQSIFGASNEYSVLQVPTFSLCHMLPPIFIPSLAIAQHRCSASHHCCSASKESQPRRTTDLYFSIPSLLARYKPIFSRRTKD
jgi:hypothetical protein